MAFANANYRGYSMTSGEPFETAKADILIVDDTVENLRLLSIMLTKEGYSVRQALNGQMALTAVEMAAPDLILLDIMMDGMDGFEVCQELKRNQKTAKIPIIFLSALSEERSKAKAFSLGGADYITKPFQLLEVVVRVHNQLAIRAATIQIEQLNAQLEARVQERTQQLEMANQQLQQELSERMRLEAQLIQRMLHDTLTELPNRTLFMKRLEQALTRAQEEASASFAVLVLDCDRFKIINDSLGHSVGDELLVAIAHQIAECLPPVTTLARMGGDEFAILLTDFASDREVCQIASAILATIAHPLQLEQYEICINASIGIALGHPDYGKPEHVLRDADTAMYLAKASGRAQYKVFDLEMHRAALQTLELETDLRRAIRQQELMVHYQPIVHLGSGQITGFEALVRWQHPQKGLIPPDQFIPVAEEVDLIFELGNWVLREACQQICLWNQTRPVGKRLTINVNLSARQFAQLNLVEQIDQILTDTQLNPQFLKLEITESAIMDNAQMATGILTKLQERRIQLGIDDFGTGYSSLSYLHSFPVDALKIDRSFVWRMDGNAEKSNLVPLIINIAHTMGMHVTAEGIETPQQLQQLRALNCNFGQGYLFSRPLQADQATDLIHSSPKW